ncbi:MAG: twin-arginine translocation signal domain-containing protein, partial [Acidobacteriota bacterium]
MSDPHVLPSSVPENSTTVETPTTDVSRRGFLRGAGVLAAAGLTAGGSTLATPDAAEAADPIGPLSARQRRVRAFQVRNRAARRLALDVPPAQEANDDENYADYRASFCKCLPHDAIGEVDPAAYQSFLNALSTGDPNAFEQIPLSSSAGRKLANPQGAYAYEMTGGDGHSARMPPAPAFNSAFTATEMAEVYWQALTRDVPFNDYGTDPLVAAAVADLNAFPGSFGATDGGVITPGTLFRGETVGDLIGPYISQFMWWPIPYGPTTVEQRYRQPVAGDDFMIDFAEWLEIQRGAAPTRSNTFDPTLRYIHSNRSLGEWVHNDFTYQGYLNAALILLGLGNAGATNNPYIGSATQGAFVTFGGPQVLDLVTRAAVVSLKAAWYQKWLVHRRLRPEVFAARVENTLNGTKTYDVHPTILNSDAVARVLGANGNALLPMAYTEGSPTHPSYPAGHATIAGACCTVLKAFFNEDYVLPDPVVASSDGLALDPWTGADLTVGNEINKLAANIAIGRDAAGVHYRTDGVDGLDIGEQVAIGMLRDYSTVYTENAEGFRLT